MQKKHMEIVGELIWLLQNQLLSFLNAHDDINNEFRKSFQKCLYQLFNYEITRSIEYRISQICLPLVKKCQKSYKINSEIIKTSKLVTTQRKKMQFQSLKMPPLSVQINPSQQMNQSNKSKIQNTQAINVKLKNRKSLQNNLYIDQFQQRVIKQKKTECTRKTKIQSNPEQLPQIPQFSQTKQIQNAQKFPKTNVPNKKSMISRLI